MALVAAVSAKSALRMPALKINDLVEAYDNKVTIGTESPVLEKFIDPCIAAKPTIFIIEKYRLFLIAKLKCYLPVLVFLAEVFTWCAKVSV